MEDFELKDEMKEGAIEQFEKWYRKLKLVEERGDKIKSSTGITEIIYEE